MSQPTEKAICDAIINVFETGQIKPKYDAVYVMDDGAGITYGRAGATDRDGNLDRIVDYYISLGGSFSAQLKPYLPLLADPRMPLTKNQSFMALLSTIARKDPKMAAAQDAIFLSKYWTPAMTFAKNNGFLFPLSHCVIFDSYIHSGSILQSLRERFPEKVPAAKGNEKTWITQYVKARRSWLAGHSKKILHKTVYRMDCFLRLISNNNWNLDLPILANGVWIKAEHFN